MTLSPRRIAGSLLRAARRAVDEALHGVRRRRALRRVAVSPPRSVIFVCHGNVCRSPYAAAAFRRLLEHDAAGTRIDSAGFIGPGRSPPEDALAAALRRGVDLGEHRSKLVDAVELSDRDLVVVMEARQRRPLGRRLPSGSVLVLGDLDPLRGQGRTIPDPWGKPSAVFDEVYERIDRCVAELRDRMSSA